MATNDFEYKSYLMFHLFLALFSLIIEIIEALTFFYRNQQLSAFTKNDLCKVEEPSQRGMKRLLPCIASLWQGDLENGPSKSHLHAKYSQCSENSELQQIIVLHWKIHALKPVVSGDLLIVKFSLRY